MVYEYYIERDNRKIKHLEIENKGYTTQVYEYKGYEIGRTHSSEPFWIQKDGRIYRYRRFDNPKKFRKISLNMICELIDNEELERWYKDTTQIEYRNKMQIEREKREK